MLANRPELMLMDEPFASLDAQTRMTMQEESFRICEAARPAVMLTTHDVEEALFLAERVAVLTPRPARIKEIVEVGRPRRWPEMIEHPRFKELVCRLLGPVRTAET